MYYFATAKQMSTVKLSLVFLKLKKGALRLRANQTKPDTELASN